MKKRKTKKAFYDRDTYAACIRAALATGLPMTKIAEYVKLLYEAVGMKKGSGNYRKLLEMVKDDTVIEDLCKEIMKHPDSDEFLKFALAFLGSSFKAEKIIEDDKVSNQVTNKDIRQQVEDADALDKIISKLLGVNETEPGEPTRGSKPLELISCELETRKFDNCQEVQYISSSDKPFEIIRRDFEHAEHLAEICEITKDENIPDRLLIVCSNKYTGLLACKYLSALLDTSNGGPFEEENGFSFEGKIPVIPVNQIAPLFPEFYGTLSVSNYNYQYYQSRNAFQPWWLQQESQELPVIVLISKNSALPADLPEKIKLLNNHPHVFIVYERNEVLNNQETEYSFEPNNERILNEVCFKMNYHTIIIPEPAVDGDYMQKVLVSAAAEDGYSISDEVNKPELLKRLKVFCRGNFEGNPSVVYLIKNAVSRKKDSSRILTNEDFAYLDRNLAIPVIQKKSRENTSKKSAIEKLKNEIYGLEEQKQKILQAINLLKLRRARIKAGLKAPDVSPVFLFYGPPGTGKSRFAELMGELMCEEGLLPGNRMISGNAVSLCKGEYVGHTAPKTRALFENHDIIFLDEIYSVAAEDKGGIDTFSQELLAELCIQLEQVAKKCDKLVIMAGYAGNVSEEHNFVQKWLGKNPGIASRITFHVGFGAYSPELEMPEIFYTLAKNADIDLEDGWRDIVIPFFKARAESEDFGNGREARRLLNNCLLAQASRLDPDTADAEVLRLITCEDIKKAAGEILRSCSGIKSSARARIGFL